MNGFGPFVSRSCGSARTGRVGGGRSPVRLFSGCAARRARPGGGCGWPARGPAAGAGGPGPVGDGRLAAGAFIFYNTNILNPTRRSHEERAESADYENAATSRSRGGAAARRLARCGWTSSFPSEAPRPARQAPARQQDGRADDGVQPSIPSEAGFIRCPASVRRSGRQDTRPVYYTYALHAAARRGLAGLQFEVGWSRAASATTAPRRRWWRTAPFSTAPALPIWATWRTPSSEDARRARRGARAQGAHGGRDDLEARREHVHLRRPDWISFEATVSTSPTRSPWRPATSSASGRRKPALLPLHDGRADPGFCAFLSARYQVRRDFAWNDMSWHRGLLPPGRIAYNVDRMIDSVKKSLDYFTKNFGPYQHRQVRILEFPRTELCPVVSEHDPLLRSDRFHRKEEGTKDIDYPFYVTAHEVAHQWWAHQVIGGNVQGCTLLPRRSRSTRHSWSWRRSTARKRCASSSTYELDNYLRGRGGERERRTAARAGRESAVHPLSQRQRLMYALRDYIGEGHAQPSPGEVRLRQEASTAAVHDVSANCWQVTCARPPRPDLQHVRLDEPLRRNIDACTTRSRHRGEHLHPRHPTAGTTSRSTCRRGNLRTTIRATKSGGCDARSGRRRGLLPRSNAEKSGEGKPAPLLPSTSTASGAHHIERDRR